jgi:hypothetical protein
MNENIKELIQLLIDTRNKWLYGDGEEKDAEILLKLSAIIGAIENNFKE